MRIGMFLICAILGCMGTLFGVKKLKHVEYVKALFPFALALFTLYALLSGIRPLFAAGLTLGLLFCVAADYLLGKPDNSRVFIFGLAGFLLGYLIYGAAFHAHGAWSPLSSAAALLLGITAFVQYKTFRRLDPALRGPVVVYIIVVSFMLFGAVNFALAAGASPARRALVLCGALLIYISDSLIAHNLFRAPIRRSDLYILPPYYAGQFCVVFQLFVE